MNRRVFVDIYNDIQMPCRFGSFFFIGVSARTGLEICAFPFVGLNHNAIIILLFESSDNPAGRGRYFFSVFSKGYGAAAFYSTIVIVITTSPQFSFARRRQMHVINIADRIPLASIQNHARQRSSGKPRIDIDRIVSCAFRNLLLIPAAGNPIRQRAHRHQIDEHQRRHQNGYKAFYFIPHCLILLFHLEAALPLLPERSKRICGQTVRRLKKRFGKNGRVIPARRFPPPRRALRVQPPPRARQPPRVRRPQASARSGQRGDSSN